MSSLSLDDSQALQAELVPDGHHALSEGELVEDTDAEMRQRALDTAAAKAPISGAAQAPLREMGGASSTTPIQISSSTETLLDLEFTDPKLTPQIHPPPLVPISSSHLNHERSGTDSNPHSRQESSSPTRLGRSSMDVMRSISMSIKKTMRSRSPSANLADSNARIPFGSGASTPLESKIPFGVQQSSSAHTPGRSSTASNQPEIDFFASLQSDNDVPPLFKGTLAPSSTTSLDAMGGSTLLQPTKPTLTMDTHSATSLLGKVTVTTPAMEFSSASVTSLDLLESSGPLDPKYEDLPTRKWTEASNFSDVPTFDLVADAIHRAFPLTDGVRPTRRLLRLEEAEKKYGNTGNASLNQLVLANSWRAVVTLTRRKIMSLASSPHRIDDIMKLWHLRFVALEKLRCFDIIHQELARLGDFDAPELFYENYPSVFPQKTGAMVTFELRLFVARLPSLQGNFVETVDKLYKLIHQCRSQLALVPTAQERATSPLRSRLAQLHLMVANQLLELKDYRLASAVLESVAATRSQDVNVISAMGRLHLQLGNTDQAKLLFDRVEALLSPSSSSSTSSSSSSSSSSSAVSSAANPNDPFGSPVQTLTGMDAALPVPPPASTTATSATPTPAAPVDPTKTDRPDLILCNRAFHHIAVDNDWESAARCFTELINLLPGNPVVVNNLAVCYLYMGNVGQALSFLESLSIEMPSVAGGVSTLVV